MPIIVLIRNLHQTAHHHSTTCRCYDCGVSLTMLKHAAIVLSRQLTSTDEKFEFIQMEWPS